MDPRSFPDFSRAATSAMQLFASIKTEVENHVRLHMERVMATMDPVRREEFEAVQAMAAKARAENEELAKRVAELEAKLGGEAKPAPKKKAPAAKPKG